MKNTKNRLWTEYLRLPKTTDLANWCGLLTKVRLNNNWVYTYGGGYHIYPFAGQWQGYTFVVTVMTGSNLVQVFLGGKFILQYQDIIQDNDTFKRYITDPRFKGVITVIQYGKTKKPQLLPPMSSVSLPKPVKPKKRVITYYNIVWNFLARILRLCSKNSKTLIWIDKLFINIINKGYYPFISTGLTFSLLKTEKGIRNFTIIWTNDYLWDRDIYIGIYYAFKSLQVINPGNLRLVISVAFTETAEFTLHNNIVFDPDLTLTQFLTWVEPNYEYLIRYNYMNDFIEGVKLIAWDINLPANSNLKIYKNGTFNNTIIRSYSTKSDKPFKSLVDPKPIKYNKRDITPLSLSKKNNKMGLIALDIETAKHPDSNVQIPVLITISHLPYLDKAVDPTPITKTFVINKALMASQAGLDGSIKHMWYSAFSYLHRISLTSATNKNVIFVHNLGGFDGYFIFKALLMQLGKDNVDSVIDKEHDFIQITANLDLGDKKIQLIFKDSYRLFGVSLEQLCNNFGVEGKISKYNKVWQNIDMLIKTKYIEDLNDFIKYANQDSLSLLLALLKAQEIYWDNHNVDICTIWSTSTLSLKIFRLKFLKQTIPSLSKHQDRFIRDGYYGGATDHYKVEGENLFYYDVNSLYPYSMLNDMPLNHTGFISNITKDMLVKGDFFGFCLAEIECPKNIKIPLLPYRIKGVGKVVYPTGKWSGVYFSEILREIMKHGYKVKPIKGHAFDKGNIFNEYINHFYDIKKNSKGPARFIAKMHLNQLYGYFGRSQETILTQNVTRDELKQLTLTSSIDSIMKIHDDLYVVLLKGNLNQEMLNELKRLRKDISFDTTDYIQKERSVKSNVAIAAAVTAYAQIEMMKYKTLPGISVYYTDTDSIFIDKQLPTDMEGIELGQMKNELGSGNKIDKAIFLGSKKYGYKTGSLEKSVFAGAQRDSITFEEIKKISLGTEIVKTYENVFTRDVSKLDIQIKERKITLALSTDKIIDNNNYIPIHINENSYIDSLLKNEVKRFIIKTLRKMISLIKNQ